MPHKLGLLGACCVAALVVGTMPALAQDQSTGAATVVAPSDSDIVVSGIRRSIESALTNKRDSNQIVDAITAEDAGKLPDATVADVLQRVPGVQVSKSFGDGGLVVIRGLQSNRTEVDGHAAFGWIIDSSNGFNEQIGRNFGFNSVSSTLTRKVEVYKTPMSNQVEGGLGGVINALTYRASDFNKPTFLIAGRGSISSKNSKLGTEFSGFATAKITDRWGVFVGAAYSNEPFYLRGFTRGSWNEIAVDQNADGKRDIRLNQIRSENFARVQRKRFGIHGNTQYQLTDNLMLRADTTYTYYATNRVINIGQFSIPTSGTITNPVYDGEYVVAGTTAGSFSGVVNPRFEVVRTLSSSVGAEWKTDRAELSAEYATTTGDFLQRQINYGSSLANPITFAFDTRGEFPSVTLADPSVLTNINNYGTMGGGAGSIANTKVHTKESSIRLDGALLFPGSPLAALRLGFRYSTLEQQRRAFAKQFGATTPITATSVINIGPVTQYNGLASTFPDLNSVVNTFNFPGFPSAFILPNSTAAADGDPRLYTSKPLVENVANFYDTKEKTYAGYVRADFKTDGVRGNIGVRVVRTEQNPSALLFSTTSGVLTQSPVSYKSSYTDILPSANITINLQKTLLLRFAASRTMARQALDQAGLAPNLIVAINTTTPSLSTAQSGNPFLLPTRATNFDASVEWYFARSGFLAATAFYKEVNGFPVRVTENAVVPGLETLGPILYSHPLNSDSGTIKGVEGSYQHTFDFLPGALRGLGVIASITFVNGKSDVTYPTTGTTTLKLKNMPLTGVSPMSYSLTGFYERPGFNFRVSYNWRGNRLFSLQSPSIYDATGNGIRKQYVKAAGSLDASASFDVSKNFNIVLNAQNLLPKASAPTYFTQSEQFVWRRDIGETRFSAGFRAKF